MNIQDFRKKCYEYLLDYVPFYKDKVFVAGGFFPRFYHNIPIRDIDVYVSKEILSDILAEYTRMNLFDAPAEQTEDKLFYSIPVRGKDFKIEIIAFHEPQSPKFVEGFDFVQCMFVAPSRDSCEYLSSTDYAAFSCVVQKNVIVNANFSFKDNLKRFENYIPKKQIVRALNETTLDLEEYQPSEEEKEIMKQRLMHAAYAKTFMRLQKYIQMGFTINESQMANLVHKMMEEK
jgi:hypothetical protein